MKKRFAIASLAILIILSFGLGFFFGENNNPQEDLSTKSDNLMSQRAHFSNGLVLENLRSKVHDLMVEGKVSTSDYEKLDEMVRVIELGPSMRELAENSYTPLEEQEQEAITFAESLIEVAN